MSRSRKSIPVSHPRPPDRLLRGPELVERESPPRVAPPPSARQRDEPDVGARPPGRPQHEGPQLADDHGVGQVVDRELHLEAVPAQPGRGGHDASVAHQDVEPVVREASPDGIPHGLERGHVHLQEPQGGGAACPPDVLDELVAGRSVAAGEVDVLGRVFGQGFDALRPESSSPYVVARQRDDRRIDALDA